MKERGRWSSRPPWVDAPRLISATVLEGSGPLRARRVFQAPIAGFRGFLDGTQRSVVAGYLRGRAGRPRDGGGRDPRAPEPPDAHLGHPARRDAHLRPARRSLDARVGHASSSTYGELLVDTTDGEAETGERIRSRCATPRSTACRRTARQLEQRLAERWCAHGERPAVHRRRDQRQRDGGRLVVHRRRGEEPPHAVRRGRRAPDACSRSAHRERSSVFRITSHAPDDRGELVSAAPRSGAATTRCGGWCASRSRTPTPRSCTRSATARTRCRAGSSPRRARSRCPMRGGTRWCTASGTVRSS